GNWLLPALTRREGNLCGDGCALTFPLPLAGKGQGLRLSPIIFGSSLDHSLTKGVTELNAITRSSDNDARHFPLRGKRNLCGGHSALTFPLPLVGRGQGWGDRTRRDHSIDHLGAG